MSDHVVTRFEQLEEIYGKPGGASVVKEIDHVNAAYRKFIEASPFCVIATGGPGGMDSSPKGDAPGFVRVIDEKTLAIPDRRGNNRLDGYRNLLADPRVGILFLVPGVGETLRVNGRASISTDPKLCESFAIDGKVPKTVLLIAVDAVYFHCARALLRSDLWNPDKRVARAALPSTGTLIAEATKGQHGGEVYDKALPNRLKTELY